MAANRVTETLQSRGDYTPPPPVVRGYIIGAVGNSHSRLTAPAAFPVPGSELNLLWVVSPEYTPARPLGPCAWSAIHGSRLPAQYAKCVVTFDDEGVPTVVWWEGEQKEPSGGSYTATAPIHLTGTAIELETGGITNVYLGAESVTEGKIHSGAVSEATLASALLGPAAGSYGLRKLGTGSTEARPGNSKITINTPHAWVIPGPVATGTLPGITVVPASGEEVLAVRVDYKIVGGTKVKFKLQRNGVNITGFTGLEATTTHGHTEPTAVQISASEAEEITVVIEEATGSPKGLSVGLNLKHIAS